MKRLTRDAHVILTTLTLATSFVLTAFFATPTQAAKPTWQPTGNLDALTCETLYASGVLNVKCFGAVGDGKTDDTDAIMAAVYGHKQGDFFLKKVFVPAGRYLITRPMKLPAVRLEGEYHWTLNAGTVFEVASCAKHQIDTCVDSPLPYVIQMHAGQAHNIGIYGNDMAAVGYFSNNFSGPIHQMHNMYVTGTLEMAYFFHSSEVADFQNLIAANNRGHGFVFENCNASVGNRLSSIGNAGIGIWIRSATGVTYVNKSDALTGTWDETTKTLTPPPASSGGMHLNEGRSEANGAIGILVEGVGLANLTNIWLERNAADAVRVEDSSNVRITGLRVSTFSPGVAIRVATNSHNVTVRDNHLTGPLATGRIVVERGTSNATVVNNTRISHLAAQPAPVDLLDRGTLRTSAVAHLPSPPQTGTWQVGDIVWNNQPADGEALGWVVVNAGTKTTSPTWAPVGVVGNVHKTIIQKAKVLRRVKATDLGPFASEIISGVNVARGSDTPFIELDVPNNYVGGMLTVDYVANKTDGCYGRTFEMGRFRVGVSRAMSGDHIGNAQIQVTGPVMDGSSLTVGDAKHHRACQVIPTFSWETTTEDPQTGMRTLRLLITLEDGNGNAVRGRVRYQAKLLSGQASGAVVGGKAPMPIVAYAL